MLAALHGIFESDFQNTFYLGTSIHICIVCLIIVLIFLSEIHSTGQLTDTDKICIFYQLCTQWRFMNQTFKGLYRTDVSKQSQFLPHSQHPLLRAYLCRWVIIKLRVTYSREQYGIRILANFISRFGKRIAHLVYRICTTDRIFITYLVSELLTNGIHHINALY